jgi:endoglucanase
MIPCGLNVRRRNDIAHTLAGWGFNHVRATFAERMIRYTGKVDPKLVSANPDLVGKTPYEVYKASVKAFTDAGIIVFPNMHLLYSGWCCSGADGNGLPYNSNWPIAGFYSAWTKVATDFADNPLVAGFDLYNECRSTTIGGTPLKPSWGDSNLKTDMRRFYQNAATAIHRISPEKLIICEGLNYAGDLSRAKALPVTPASRTVYSLHDYSWFHAAGQSYADYRAQMDRHGGYLVRDNIAPVWIGEFGINATVPSSFTSNWWSHFMSYAVERDLDVCLWHLDGTVHVAHEPVTNAPKTVEGQREGFSLFKPDFATPTSPVMLEALQSLMR